MKTSDVTDTLNMALKVSDCDQANVVHKPRLLSDNGASYISGELAEYIKDNDMSHVRSTISSTDTRQDRTLASDA